MRKIEFRIWDTHAKEFIEFGVGGLRYDYILNDIFFDNFDELSRYKIQQYTGLKDKNGKEIYEGDIIKGEEFDDGSSLYIRKQPRIITEKVFYDEWFGYDFLRFQRNTIEVIGNIYENPELLE